LSRDFSDAASIDLFALVNTIEGVTTIEFNFTELIEIELESGKAGYDTDIGMCGTFGDAARDAIL